MYEQNEESIHHTRKHKMRSGTLLRRTAPAPMQENYSASKTFFLLSIFLLTSAGTNWIRRCGVYLQWTFPRSMP